mgnify:CR=1 FL=1
MGLLDEITAEQDASRVGPRCYVALALGNLAADERADLEAALDDKGIRHTVIGAVLRRRGVKIGDHSVGRHRRGLCGCSRG